MTLTQGGSGRRRATERRRALMLRVGLGVLCVANLGTGGWAYGAPRSFYEDFPGGGMSWVSLLPPFNEHLTTDVGGFYLAFGVLFAWAAVTLSRPLLQALLTSYLLASALHVGYHLTHLEGYSTADKVGQTLAFAIPMLLALALLGASVRRGASGRRL